MRTVRPIFRRDADRRQPRRELAFEDEQMVATFLKTCPEHPRRPFRRERTSTLDGECEWRGFDRGVKRAAQLGESLFVGCADEAQGQMHPVRGHPGQT